MVGRDGELAAVLAAAARVPSAGLVTVLVSGEPGIGKSHLLAAVTADLRGRGWPVLAVRADRLERQVPYAALATALRTLTAASSYTAELRRDALAALDLPAADFGQACAAATRLLTALVAAGPVALAVDDLHELDDDSLALLAVVLGRLAAAPVAVVATVRPHLPAPNPAADELVERLTDRGEVVPVELGTLAAGDLAAIVAPILGGPPDEALAREVHRRADGNPFFAAEIARSLADSELVRRDGDHARLTVAPSAITLNRRGALLRRVVPLDADALAVARTLAVTRSLALDRIDLVAAVTGRPAAAVAAAFDDLVRANVVVPDAGRYRFAHDIVADALYGEIGPAECRRLHGLVAKWLLAARKRGDAVDLPQLAWHLSESAAPGDTTAVAVLTEAAHHSLTSAPEAAAAFCARALALLGDAASGRERGTLLALRCRALARASRPAAAVPPGRAALAALPPGEERDRTVTAVLGSLFNLGRINEALEVADEQTEPAPSAARAQRAVLLLFANRVTEAEAEAAAAAATRTASPAEDVVVSCQLTIMSSMLFRHDETVRLADRALRQAGDSTTLRLQALAVGASTGALAGLVRDATRRLAEAKQLGGPTAFASELNLTAVVLDWLGGRWDTALEGVRTLGAELATREHTILVAALAAIELDIRTWRGELVLAAPLAARPVPAVRNMANLYALARADFLVARGEFDAARQVLADAIDDPRTASYSCVLLGRRVELELATGHPDEAARHCSTLVEVATPRVSPWSVTTLHRTVGVVNGDPDALRRAVGAAHDGGLVFERARAQLALGELDRDAADDLVAAYRTFARLGVHGLRRRAGRRLHDLGAKVPRVRSRAAGVLTESEEKVARLVQQGMRNREIAAALHYSPRSVEVYLSRVYAKLRVASRLELARALDAMDAADARP